MPTFFPARLPVPERRPGGDARAEKGRRGGRVEVRGDLQRERLVDDDLLGVAAEGHAAEMLVLAVVGEGRAGRAVLLEALRAVVAGAAAVDEAADRGEVARLELRDARADSRDAAEDLVARHDRILREAPLVSGEVEIAVAAAVVTVVVAGLIIAPEGVAPAVVKGAVAGTASEATAFLNAVWNQKNSSAEGRSLNDMSKDMFLSIGRSVVSQCGAQAVGSG